MHARQKALDGTGWIDPDKSKREGKVCVITAHGTARSGFRTRAKDDRLGNNRRYDQEAAELRILICVNGVLKHVNTPDSYLRERCANIVDSVRSLA